MFAEAGIFASNEGVDEIGRNLVVADNAAVFSVEITYFLSLAVFENVAVPVENLGSGRHGDDFIKIVGAGDDVIDNRDEDRQRASDHPCRECEAGRPF